MMIVYLLDTPKSCIILPDERPGTALLRMGVKLGKLGLESESQRFGIMEYLTYGGTKVE